jgi:hypothetical protein
MRVAHGSERRGTPSVCAYGRECDVRQGLRVLVIPLRQPRHPFQTDCKQRGAAWRGDTSTDDFAMLSAFWRRIKRGRGEGWPESSRQTAISDCSSQARLLRLPSVGADNCLLVGDVGDKFMLPARHRPARMVCSRSRSALADRRRHRRGDPVASAGRPGTAADPPRRGAGAPCSCHDRAQRIGPTDSTLQFLGPSTGIGYFRAVNAAF